MPVNPQKGEREEDFISRCIGEEISAGYEQSQAAAICYSYWRKDKMSKLSGQDKIVEKLKYNRDFRGINLQAAGLEDACWEGYIAIGTKILDGREVPNCVPEGENMESVQPTIDSSYPGEAATTGSTEMVAVEGELVIHGYHTKNFKMCPGATALFEHILTMPLEEEYIGMVRSAAQVADNVFGIEKRVIESESATEEDVKEAILLVGDFKDIIEEIDEETGMIHDTSFMDGHIVKINSYLK